MMDGSCTEAPAVKPPFLIWLSISSVSSAVSVADSVFVSSADDSASVFSVVSTVSSSFSASAASVSAVLSAVSAAYTPCDPSNIIPVSPRIIPHFFLMPFSCLSNIFLFQVTVTIFFNLRKKIPVRLFFHPSESSSAWHDGSDCTADHLRFLLLFLHGKP